MSIFDNVDFDGLFQTFNDGVDALIDNGGILVEVVYPPLKTDCPNCVLNPLSRVSANIYQAGGPYPFTNGSQCPNCLGVGHIITPSTASIRVIVINDPKSYWLNSVRGRQTGADVTNNMHWNSPDGVIQLWGKLNDLPNIERADFIFINSSMKNLHKNKYKKYGQASTEGFGQNRYFMQMLEKI